MFAGRMPDDLTRELDSGMLFAAVGELAMAALTVERMRAMEHFVSHGRGSCAGMWTDNTMSCLTEAIVLGLPDNGTVPVVFAQRIWRAKQAGRQVIGWLTRDIKARDLLTPQAIRNTFVMDMATGGSTNSVLHLMTLAQQADITFSLMGHQRHQEHDPAADETGAGVESPPRGLLLCGWHASPRVANNRPDRRERDDRHRYDAGGQPQCSTRLERGRRSLPSKPLPRDRRAHRLPRQPRPGQCGSQEYSDVPGDAGAPGSRASSMPRRMRPRPCTSNTSSLTTSSSSVTTGRRESRECGTGSIAPIRSEDLDATVKQHWLSTDGLRRQRAARPQVMCRRKPPNVGPSRLRDGDIITLDLTNCRLDVELGEALLRARLTEVPVFMPRLHNVCLLRYVERVSKASQGPSPGKRA